MNRTALVIGRGRTALQRFRAPASDRANRTAFTVVGLAATLALLTTLIAPVSSAQAIEYPTWEDLQSAKASTSSAAGKVTEIQGLIADLQAQVEQTQAESEARGLELEVAQEKYDDATRRATDLQAQADASATVADAATRQAGQLAAQLYRTGGTDLSVNLFLDGDSSDPAASGSTDGTDGADALLSKLGNMSKLVERSTGVYEEAQTAQNSAQALGDSAKEAQAERETLRIAAEGALEAAQAAADAAAAALVESEAKSVELAAQLAFLQDAEATTSAGYQAGVVERARIEAERVEAERVAREAAAAAARAAAAAAAAARPSGGSSGGSAPGSSLGGGYTSGSGWGVPASGRITGGYGPRSVICGGGSCSGGYHYGTDLGTGCYAPIYAASAGTVTYAGRLGTYGNFVKIDHGNGVSTGYAHIVDGGIFVRAGQQVSVGDNIASSGSTGASTACHLHFEVWLNGVRSNAVPFMAARGASLG
ncbi:M23 family metallopeptidase [Cryobacterium melibiosiphilum]|uniref:M23 family metallopeptidase n=1 Tax=Cryobacterium melibiosiphilum TaxID=995039 RepID=A0A3A5M7Z1_9MICO|nr:M23 family metallopeptidase [Cryobacterium melibiosiphilum]RJT85090.1 M23 family metallopeptidase [Cryobacterium melibiosiphilum]